MKRAFVIGCITGESQYLSMATTCARSIRTAGNNEDVVIATIDKRVEDALGHKYIVKRSEPIRHPALAVKQGSNERHQAFLNRIDFTDIQKLHFWNLPEYDKVLALDVDVIVYKPCVSAFIYRELSLTSAPGGSPVNSAVMVLKPDKDVYADMIRTVMSATFSLENGWNNYGPIDFEKGWDHYAARGAQGFLYWYFGLIQKKLRYVSFGSYLHHFGGEEKFSQKYINQSVNLLTF